MACNPVRVASCRGIFTSHVDSAFCFEAKPEGICERLTLHKLGPCGGDCQKAREPFGAALERAVGEEVRQ